MSMPLEYRNSEQLRSISDTIVSPITGRSSKDHGNASTSQPFISEQLHQQRVPSVSSFAISETIHPDSLAYSRAQADSKMQNLDSFISLRVTYYFRCFLLFFSSYSSSQLSFVTHNLAALQVLHNLWCQFYVLITNDILFSNYN